MGFNDWKFEQEVSNFGPPVISSTWTLGKCVYVVNLCRCCKTYCTVNPILATVSIEKLNKQYKVPTPMGQHGMSPLSNHFSAAFKHYSFHSSEFTFLYYTIHLVISKFPIHSPNFIAKRIRLHALALSNFCEALCLVN